MNMLTNGFSVLERETKNYYLTKTQDTFLEYQNILEMSLEELSSLEDYSYTKEGYNYTFNIFKTDNNRYVLETMMENISCGNIIVTTHIINNNKFKGLIALEQLELNLDCENSYQNLRRKLV